MSAIDVAAEIVRTAFAAFEHALDQAQDAETRDRNYIIAIGLEGEMHTLIDKAGRLCEFDRIGPR